MEKILFAIVIFVALIGLFSHIADTYTGAATLYRPTLPPKIHFGANKNIIISEPKIIETTLPKEKQLPNIPPEGVKITQGMPVSPPQFGLIEINGIPVSLHILTLSGVKYRKGKLYTREGTPVYIKQRR